MKLLPEAAVQAALAQAEGNVTCAAATFEMPRGELWDFIQQRPGLLSFLTDLREGMVDHAESYLREASEARKAWAITFILNTLGKNIGFDKQQPRSPAERATPTPSAGPPDFTRLSPEQFVRYQQLMAMARGEDGETPPEPEFMQRLDHIGTTGELGDPAGAGVRQALSKFAGDVTRAAKLLGVTRAELMEYLRRRPELQDAATDVREEIVDHAESELRIAVSEKKPWAIRFVLKTLGACRGYGVENSSSGSSELRVPSSGLKNADSGARQFGTVADGALADTTNVNEIGPVEQAGGQIKFSRAAQQVEKQETLTDSGSAGDRRAPHPPLPPQSREEGKKSDLACPPHSRAEVKSSDALQSHGRKPRAEMKTGDARPPQGRESPADVETSDAQQLQGRGQVRGGETIATQCRDEVKTFAPLRPTSREESKSPPDSLSGSEPQHPPKTVPRLESTVSGRGADIPVCQTPGGLQRLTHWLPPLKSG